MQDRQGSARVGRISSVLVVLLLGCGPPPNPTGPVGTPPPDRVRCATAEDCGGSRPYCVEGRCVACGDDGDCLGGPDCRICGAAGACETVAGCCRGDLDCPGSFECERAAGRATGRCAGEEETR